MLSKNSSIFQSLLLLAGIVFLTNCANRGSGPQGGPKDTLPPIVMSCEPANGATQVTSSVIEILFDEFVVLDNPINNITISPPQKKFPNFKTNGKKLRITFEDTLKANTTYSIDFGNSIADNNEKNVLKGYNYTFSTGDKIDSLQISGIVLDAKTLMPKENITVGIHSDLSDSAMLKMPFVRIAKTNKNGEFTVRNVADGNYKLYALKDPSNMGYYQPVGADIAFYDSIITPQMHLHAKVDTLWKDSLKTSHDSLLVNTFVEYYPKDILLKSFVEKALPKQFLKKNARTSDKSFQFVFNCAVDSLPQIQLINDSLTAYDWYIQEPILRADSLVYWITDSAIYTRDTLKIALSYLKTDSLWQLEQTTDTLTMVTRKKGIVRKKNKEEEEKPVFLTFTHNINKALEVYDTLQLTFNEPIRTFSRDSIHLFTVKDTIETPIDFNVLFNDSVCARIAYLYYAKEFGERYQLRIDSAAFTSIYDKVNTAFNKPFSVKSLESYGNIYIKFTTIPEHAVVELIANNKDESVVSVSPIIDGEAYFEDIAPGTYWVRFYIDANQNKKWDTGDLLQHQQPETMYYYPKELSVRANWDIEETWNYPSIPPTKQRIVQP